MTAYRTAPIPTSWAVLIAKYLAFRRAEGRSPQSIRTWNERLSHLARALKLSPDEVTSDALLHFMSDQTWSSETRRARVQTYRSFWKWLAKETGAPNLAAELASVPIARPNPNPVPYDIYLGALLRSDKRTRAILRLAGEAGLRRGEIAILRREDLVVTDSGPTLTVHGKGGHIRRIPVSGEVAHVVFGSPEGYLFPGKIDGHLSARRISELAKLHLPNPWTIHKLRHMFATRGYAVSRDLVTMQELLGHASPNTTRIYIASNDKALRDVVEAVANRSLDPDVDQRIRDVDTQRITIDLDAISSESAVEIIAVLSQKLRLPPRYERSRTLGSVI